MICSSNDRVLVGFMVRMKRCEGRQTVSSLSMCPGSRSGRLDSASARFVAPGLYWILRLYCSRSSFHRMTFGLTFRGSL